MPMDEQPDGYGRQCIEENRKILRGPSESDRQLALAEGQVDRDLLWRGLGWMHQNAKIHIGWVSHAR